MAQIAECIGIRDLADGAIEVQWEGGVSQRFVGGLEEMRQFALSVDTDTDMARKLLLAWYLARSDDDRNRNLVVGKRLTFDVSAANPIRVQ